MKCCQPFVQLRGDISQTKKLFALLLSGGNDSFKDLTALLKSQTVKVWSAQSCEEVARLLNQTHPELVFTGTTLSDGSWSDVVSLSEMASAPTNVIVVGKCKDTGLYLSTMNSGAFYFVLPPFESADLARVVQSAAENVRSRREEQALKMTA